MDDDRTRIEELEQRLNDLEARNEALETRLERKRRDPSVSRRQALAGVLGGTLLGAGTGAGAYSIADTDSESRASTPNDAGIGRNEPGGESAGVIRPRPGAVQSAIDDLAADGRGLVRLLPGETYDPSSPWELRRGVTLDCNGARVALSSDIDLVHVHPGTRVLDARNEISASSYTSTVFTFDSAFDGEYVPTGSTAIVRGGLTEVGDETDGEGGTLFRFRSRTDEPIYSVRCVGHDGQGIDLITEFDSGTSTDGEWINSNRVQGTFGGYRRGVHLHGANRLSENEFTGWWQTGWDCKEFCVLEGDARENYVVAAIWDAKSCANVPIRFGANTDRNMICSLASYRDGETVLPIEYNGAESNVVLDMWQLQALLSDYAL